MGRARHVGWGSLAGLLVPVAAHEQLCCYQCYHRCCCGGGGGGGGVLLLLASEASQEVVWRAAGDLWLPSARRRVKLQAQQ